MRWLFFVAFAGCGFQHGALDNSTPGSDSGMPRMDGGATPDAFVAPDARTCFGAGLVNVCLASAPMQPLTLTTGNLDTGVDTNCTQVINGMCVLAGSTVDVPATINVRAIGGRPLVIVAATTLTVTGTIDASSRRMGYRGSGSNGTPCTLAGEGLDESHGSSGGAGGSFGDKGGNGGNGNTNFSSDGGVMRIGGTAGNATAPTAVRGGCAGAKGGDGSGTSPGGGGGASGGAIYLIAGNTIDVAMTGRLFASGAGGGGASYSGGGGGGGSGGLIGLDAPTITMAGIVAANGGAGSGGGGNNLGAAGEDGTTELYTTAALGGGGSLGRGDGGTGSAGAITDGGAGANSDGGGGGGGGSAGVAWVKGALTGTRFSPAASLN
jgi:hypothetical protein